MPDWGKIGSAFVEIKADIAGLKTQLAQGGVAVKSWAEKNSDTMKSVGKAMTIAGAAITGALALSLNKAVAFGDQMDKMSKRTGIAAETLSALAYAGEISGTNLNAVEMSLRFLARSMDDTSRGTGEAKEKFAAMGISVTDVHGKLRPVVEVMKEAASKIAAMTNETEQVTAATDLFGSRTGTQLLPLLKEGATGIEELMNRAKDLGLVMSTEAAAAAAEFQDRMTELKSSISFAAIELGNNLIPTLQPLIERMTEIIGKVSQWTKEHPELTRAISEFGLVVGGIMVTGGPLLMMAPTILRIAESLKVLNVSMSTFLVTGGEVGLLLGTIAAGVYTAKKAYDQFKEVLDAAKDATKGMNDQQVEMVKMIGTIGPKILDVNDSFGDLGINVDKLNKLFGTNFTESTNAADALKKMSGILNDQVPIQQKAQVAIKGTTDTVTALQSSWEEVGKQYSKWVSISGKGYTATNAQRIAYLQELLPSIDKESEAYRGITNTINELKKEQEDAAEKTKEATDKATAARLSEIMAMQTTTRDKLKLLSDVMKTTEADSAAWDDINKARIQLLTQLFAEEKKQREANLAAVKDIEKDKKDEAKKAADAEKERAAQLKKDLEDIGKSMVIGEQAYETALKSQYDASIKHQDATRKAADETMKAIAGYYNDTSKVIGNAIKDIENKSKYYVKSIMQDDNQNVQARLESYDFFWQGYTNETLAGIDKQIAVWKAYGFDVTELEKKRQAALLALTEEGEAGRTDLRDKANKEIESGILQFQARELGMYQAQKALIEIEYQERLAIFQKYGYDTIALEKWRQEQLAEIQMEQWANYINQVQVGINTVSETYRGLWELWHNADMKDEDYKEKAIVRLGRWVDKQARLLNNLMNIWTSTMNVINKVISLFGGDSGGAAGTAAGLATGGTGLIGALSKVGAAASSAAGALGSAASAVGSAASAAASAVAPWLAVAGVAAAGIGLFAVLYKRTSNFNDTPSDRYVMPLTAEEVAAQEAAAREAIIAANVAWGEQRGAGGMGAGSAGSIGNQNRWPVYDEGGNFIGYSLAPPPGRYAPPASAAVEALAQAPSAQMASVESLISVGVGHLSRIEENTRSFGENLQAAVQTVSQPFQPSGIGRGAAYTDPYSMYATPSQGYQWGNMAEYIVDKIVQVQQQDPGISRMEQEAMKWRQQAIETQQFANEYIASQEQARLQRFIDEENNKEKYAKQERDKELYLIKVKQENANLAYKIAQEEKVRFDMTLEADKQEFDQLQTIQKNAFNQQIKLKEFEAKHADDEQERLKKWYDEVKQQMLAAEAEESRIHDIALENYEQRKKAQEETAELLRQLEKERQQDIRFQIALENAARAEERERRAAEKWAYQEAELQREAIEQHNQAIQANQAANIPTTQSTGGGGDIIINVSNMIADQYGIDQLTDLILQALARRGYDLRNVA